MHDQLDSNVIQIQAHISDFVVVLSLSAVSTQSVVKWNGDVIFPRSSQRRRHKNDEFG